MSHPLLECTVIGQAPSDYLHSIGSVFSLFDAQDSGNVSYGVQLGNEHYFIKTAGLAEDPRPFLKYPARVELLRNAARLNASASHPLLPKLRAVIESPDGPLLVYPWLEGELLGVPRERRDDPASSYQRFRSLPLAVIQACLDSVLDLHTTLSEAGWIAVDFYDGPLLYEFPTARLGAVDLDTYQDTPFSNEMGKMFGSPRFMAPEEFELGALIDEQTTVFIMGRMALIFLSDGTLNFEAFRGPRTLYDVVAQACQPVRAQRFAAMSAFYGAWRAARGV